MLFFGVVWRFIDLGYPSHLTWDEHHFVENARNYLAGKPDWNDHPPLGKLLIALSMHSFRDGSFFFRLPAALLGTLSLLWGGLLARRTFASRTAGFIAAAFLSVDGFLISYSRTGLLDGMLTSFSLLALYLMTFRQLWSVLACGVIIGCAMAIKLSALTLFGPFLALALSGGLSKLFASKLPEDTPLLFNKPLLPQRTELIAYLPALCIAGLVYLSFWRVGLNIANQESSFSAAWTAHQAMMKHHAALTDWEHPLLSRWWTWPLPTRPILISKEHEEFGVLRVMTTMGNPLLWWSVVVAFVYAAMSAFSTVLRKTSPKPGEWFLTLAFLAYLSPWIVTNRDSYIYHYLPAYAIGLVLLAGVVWHHFDRRKVFYGLCTVTVVSAFYAPVWTKQPVTQQGYRARPLVTGWHLP